MKKLLLKIVLSATAILAFGGFLSPIVATAEEGIETPEISVEITNTDIVSSEEETAENESNNAVVETETSKWFDEYIMPLIIQYGANVVSFATVAFIALKDTQRTKSALFGAVGAITQSNTDNKNTTQAVQEFKEACLEEIKALKENHAEEIKALKEAFVEAVQEIKESVAVKVEDIDDIAHKLLDVEKIAYGNTAHLVNNGTAKRIAEVIGNVKKADDEK